MTVVVIVVDGGLVVVVTWQSRERLINVTVRDVGGGNKQTLAACRIWEFRHI